MTRSRKVHGAVAALVVAVGLLPCASPALAQAGHSLAQGTDLWGGPGARGTGDQGARFDTTLYVSALADASGTIDFYAGGAVAATVPFDVPARGVATIAAPAALEGRGAFLYRVRSDSAVTAWSETYNDTPSGRYGVSLSGFTAADLLAPGDEANGGGAEASTVSDAARSRTNVGLLCVPTGTDTCRAEVAAWDGGTLLGTGSLEAVPGAAAQKPLVQLVPATAERSGLLVRVRVLTGSAQPYVIRNNNKTSDGSTVPLAVARGAFSTAPVITDFTITPLTGCSPQLVTITWAATDAARVTISALAGDLPASGSATATITATTDVLMTAYSSTGASSSNSRRVDIVPPTEPPTPSPATATLGYEQVFTGTLPLNVTQVTWAFTQQESQGSTFLVSGNTFTYVAGTTAGTDVVTLTANGLCGPATATFTATVVAPGAPRILTFAADPSPSCQLFNNIVLSWTTADTTRVQLTGYDFPLPANGSYGFSYPPSDTSPSKSYTLTAFNALGQKTTKSLTVPVDASLEYPVVTPHVATVPAGTFFTVIVTGVTNYQYMGWYQYSMPSGGHFNCGSGTGTCTYQAGQVSGTQDIVKITYHNGCGTTFSEFRANVVP
ncbi:hypothetical protein FBQ97_04590 [Acidobacteria bacterium ACD]|nr:MAG: hypothetical protein EDX89_21465 [Acidobacteriota bacterium]MCE7958557.1 hypothetical protein [Acidobacteria bacterium ACB2]MDL1949077.1 hypothetical protein [Acidobacteria bacterium ACD]